MSEPTPEPPPSDEPSATAKDVRILGAFFLVAGSCLWWWLSEGRYFGGVIPAGWVSGGLAVLGLVMILFPKPFRRRASRFNEIGKGKDD